METGERIYLYNVTFAPNRKARMLHLMPSEHFVAKVEAVEDHKAVTAYHLVRGNHLVPDFEAIRSAIIPQHRKAFDRASSWWFPKYLHGELTGQLDRATACSLTLYGSKGNLLGTLYATPYLYSRGTAQG